MKEKRMTVPGMELTNVQCSVTVDEEDLEMLGQYKWHMTDRGYVATWIEDHLVYQHWLVLGLYIWGFRFTTRHINGRKLDNRQSNLEVELDLPVPQPPQSGHRGVIWLKAGNKWQTMIYVGGGKQKYIGTYTLVEDAIQAYREAAPRYGLLED